MPDLRNSSSNGARRTREEVTNHLEQEVECLVETHQKQQMEKKASA